MVRLEEFELSPRRRHVVMQVHPTATTLVRKEVDETMQIGEEVHGRHFGVASVLKLKVAFNF